MEYLIALDVGTSNMRAIVYDSRGVSRFTATFSYSSSYLPPNLVEQDPGDWRRALAETLGEAGEYAATNGLSIAAIAVTSQRASVFPVDREGNPLHRALMWQDKRSLGLSQGLHGQIPAEDLYHKTGLRINPYFSLPKVLWFREMAPGIYRRAHKLVGVQDYVIHLLTGEFKTDWSQAARTMLMNIQTFQWDGDLLGLFRIDRGLLCDLCPPGSVAGGLTPQWAGLTSVKAGTPVIMSGGDQQCAAIASNVMKPGTAKANTGTGSFVIAHSERPVFDHNCRVLCSASAIPGKWIVEAGIFNTGAIYQWFREQFYHGHDTAYAAMEEEAAKSPLGANGVILLPHFEGSASPYWNPNSKGLFFNLSLGSQRGDFVRAILEGIALEIAENISLIEGMVGDLSVITVAGGMTKSELFNSIQAHAFGKEIIRHSSPEASSLGAAISAFVTLGFYGSYDEALSQVESGRTLSYRPDVQHHEKYRELRRRRHLLYQSLLNGGVYGAFLQPL